MKRIILRLWILALLGVFISFQLYSQDSYRKNEKIRTNYFEEIQITTNEKEKVYSFLAETSDEIKRTQIREIKRFDLPFYSSVDLYELEMSSDHKYSYEYIMYDESATSPYTIMDFTNEPIYKFSNEFRVVNNETIDYSTAGWDISLENESFKKVWRSNNDYVRYIIFFFDAVHGRHGKFHVIHSKGDIPWNKNNVPNIAEKIAIEKSTYPIRFLSQSRDSVFYKVSTAFNGALFETEVAINKNDGVISIGNENIVKECECLASEQYFKATKHEPEYQYFKNKKVIEAEKRAKYAGEVFELVEENAEPITGGGGMVNLLKWIEENIEYPAEAKAKGIQGRVYIKFIVDTDGSVYDVSTARGGLAGGLNEEAIRLIKQTKWKPGKQKGYVVKQRMILPVKFSL